MFSNNDLKQIYDQISSILVTIGIGIGIKVGLLDATGKSPGDVGYEGPIVQVGNEMVTTVPTGTLITLDTEPTPLPTTPLTGRKWIRFMNEDLIDIELCDENGVVFRVLEPGAESPTYAANEEILFYGKVATGTADTGLRVEEGK